MYSTLKSAALSSALIALFLVLSACTPTASPAQSSATAQEESAAAETSEGAASDSAIVLDRINLNDMTREQLLETIPDFGNRMVREFFEYQPYVSIQQFRREIGKYVDDEQVASYESYVYVPVDVNESDAETLKQIPGLNDVRSPRRSWQRAPSTRTMPFWPRSPNTSAQNSLTQPPRT